MTERTEMQQLQWKLILDAVEAIKLAEPAPRGSGRSQAYYTEDGTVVATILDLGMLDGTRKVFHIRAVAPPTHGRPGLVPTIHVDRWFHSNEPYWEREIAHEPDRRVVIEGVHYRLGTATKPSSHNGMSGRQYDIEFFDGRRVTTCDLWYQGPIPPKFRDALPDNAKLAEVKSADVREVAR
jgi:hypothetical protein